MLAQLNQRTLQFIGFQQFVRAVQNINPMARLLEVCTEYLHGSRINWSMPVIVTAMEGLGSSLRVLSASLEGTEYLSKINFMPLAFPPRDPSTAAMDEKLD